MLCKIEEMWDIIEFRVCLSADIAKRLLNFGGKSLSLTVGRPYKERSEISSSIDAESLPKQYTNISSDGGGTDSV